MKMKVQPEKLLDEGKFGDFVKASALGAGIALSPMVHAGQVHKIAVEEVPIELVKSYNTLDKSDALGIVQAQHMAEEAIMQVGEQAVAGAPEQTKAWKTAKETYAYLVGKDYTIATAFLGKFNVNAKKLFGSQIRSFPKPVAESADLPVRKSYVNEYTQPDHVYDDRYETWKQKVVDSLSDGLLDLTVMSDQDIKECDRCLRFYFGQRAMEPEEAARKISVDMKRHMRTGKSQFLSPEEIYDVKQDVDEDDKIPVNPYWRVV